MSAVIGRITNWNVALTHVQFGPGDDFETGGNSADQMYGGGGNDILWGNDGDDALFGEAGNDELRGGRGVDTLTGGAGNDTYHLSSSDLGVDIIVEAAGGGSDTVSVFNRDFSLAGLTNVENLILVSGLAIHGVGNELNNYISGNLSSTVANRLEGLGGNDTLEGGFGDVSDMMIGGAGNDTYISYYGDTLPDLIVEEAGEGRDTIVVFRHYSLAGFSHVENLTLGPTYIGYNLIGNYGDNVLTWSFGDNRLRGSLGADTLIGGDGNDTFVFAAVAESTGASHDQIVGMNLNAASKFDFTVVPVAIAAAVTSGALNAASFEADLSAAVDGGLSAFGAILFDPSSGTMNGVGRRFLVVDVNGDGAYSDGDDFVVDLKNATGDLTLDDFI